MTTVAVDFDGVLHAYSRGWQDGSIYDSPVPGALEALRQLMSEYAVFIFTSRNTAQVAAWLSEAGFETSTDDSAFRHDRDWDGVFWDARGTLLVTNRKLSASAYIDDRAIRFTSWDQALADLSALGEA
jgi:hypothetical protein